MKSEVFHGENNVVIEYIFQKVSNDSDTLIVSFPGAGGAQAGYAAGWDAYGYLLTLRAMNINGLFIKGNAEFAKSRMTFRNHEPVIEDAVSVLIQKCKEECKAKRIIAIGSSMGGFCALYYGLKHDWDIIAGSPPYAFTDDASLLYAAGTIGADERAWLNSQLPGIIRLAGKRKYDKKCFVSFGEGERNWLSDEHGKKLVADMKAANIPYECKLYPFSDHQSVHQLFPEILTWKLKNYLGIESDSDDTAEIETAPEVRLAEAWEKGRKTIQEILVKRDRTKIPHLDINGCMHYGNKDPQLALRNFVYINSGWFWNAKKNIPVRMEKGDTYWRIATKIDNNTACGFLFQDAFLKYLESQEYDEMYAWLAENTRQFFNGISVNCKGNVNSAVYRLHYLIAFHTLSKYREKAPTWTSWIAEQIDIDMKFIASKLLMMNVVWKYNFLLLCLHVNKYFSSDKNICDDLYQEIFSLLMSQVDFDFDSNGVCISGQMLKQDTLLPNLYRITKFIEDNSFKGDKLLSRLKRKYEKIATVNAHAVPQGGALVSIGDTPVDEKARYLSFGKRVAGNLILRTSNLAFLEDETSLSYITVGGGKNIHAVKKHSDLLSFTWYYDGKQIFCDPGRGAGESDMYASSVIAHNAFICEGKEYLIPTYDDWTTIDSVEETENHVMLDMSHRLLDGIELKRKFLWLKPNIVILMDEAESKTEESFTQNFMMEDHLVQKIDGRRAAVQIAPGFYVSITQCMANQEFVLEEYHGTDKTDDKGNLRGSLLTRKGTPCKGLNLAYTQKGNKAKFFTVIECHSSSKKEVKEKKIKNLHFDEHGKMMIEFVGGNEK